MQYLVGNWKSNKTSSEVKAWFDGVKSAPKTSNTQVVVCPSFIHLDQASQLISSLPDWQLGAQDASRFPMGAYTGAVSAASLKDYCQFVILGHSERRKHFAETSQHVATKLELALDAGLTPIVCIDEPYASEQLNLISEHNLDKILVAYEPLSAIGTGDPATPEHTVEVTNHIKELTGGKTPVLYGGSVTPDNVTGFVKTGVIDGYLVGGVSLKPDKWLELIEVVSNLA